MSSNSAEAGPIKILGRKVQIPWRDPVKGPLLKKTILNLSLIHGIHLKDANSKLKKDERWQIFATEVFKQPEFHEMEGSFRSIREQFEGIIKERAKFHGWTDANGGVTGNLSNHSGDLDAIDKAVKQILIDQEHEKNEKELSKNLSKDLEEKEVTILTKSLSKKSREKRKIITNEGSSGSSSSSTMESQSFDLDRTIHEYLSSSLQRKNADELSDMNKKQKIFYLTNIEIKLLSLLNNKSIDVIATEACIMDDVSIEALRNMGI